jgi:hypothetical protein
LGLIRRRLELPVAGGVTQGWNKMDVVEGRGRKHGAVAPGQIVPARGCRRPNQRQCECDPKSLNFCNGHRGSILRADNACRPVVIPLLNALEHSLFGLR